ncbi:uncharacterized protein CEXT_64201 [Caerostris extrusa]|uniref:Uncharacterized protein n=1 Tax=Caerostris extrusa TaxID=172846 RepID=A0AAV4Q5P8_CAEEX|nr:uncharacterized protein CEXT_64201 [Caerostris extrusa]
MQCTDIDTFHESDFGKNIKFRRTFICEEISFDSDICSAELCTSGREWLPCGWMEEEPAAGSSVPPRWGYGPESQLGIVSGEEVGGSYFHLNMENGMPCYSTPVHGYRPHQADGHAYRTSTQASSMCRPSHPGLSLAPPWYSTEASCHINSPPSSWYPPSSIPNVYTSNKTQKSDGQSPPTAKVPPPPLLLRFPTHATQRNCK